MFTNYCPNTSVESCYGKGSWKIELSHMMEIFECHAKELECYSGGNGGTLAVFLKFRLDHIISGILYGERRNQKQAGQLGSYNKR